MRVILPMLVIALVIVIAAVVAYASSAARNYATSNEVVPGVPTRAPKDWAGAHTPEARLHRRLRDAVAAMRANRGLDDAAYVDARTTLEQEVLAVDERLIAVAALPERHRAERLTPVARAVEAIEAVVAEMADATMADADTDGRLAEVRTRLDLVAQARAELAGFSTTTDLGRLRNELESDSEIGKQDDSETGGQADTDDTSGEAPSA